MATIKNLTINDTGILRIPSGTNATRPTGTVAGQTRMNTDFDVLEVFDGSSWYAADGLPRGQVLSGGTTKQTGTHIIHTFTGSGIFRLWHTGYIEVFIVGGGGAGGKHHGGGGGGGGVWQGTKFVFTGNTYTDFGITVGPGGTSTTGSAATIGGTGGSGTNSFAFGETAYGGGGGGNYPSGGANGGSGGGPTNWSVSETGGSSTNNQGSQGSRNRGATNEGGGGGGAGSTAQGNRGNNGGHGIPSYVSGELKWYAGGGGAGIYPGYTYDNFSGYGGRGGGGTGGNGPHGSGQPGAPGTANLGGGGGGTADYTISGGGGNGGSGIVIIRYLIGTGR